MLESSESKILVACNAVRPVFSSRSELFTHNAYLLISTRGFRTHLRLMFVRHIDPTAVLTWADGRETIGGWVQAYILDEDLAKMQHCSKKTSPQEADAAWAARNVRRLLPYFDFMENDTTSHLVQAVNPRLSR